jgi:hypothetical protein
MVKHVKPPGDDVTVYDETAMPPFEIGALQLTSTEELLGVALIFVGLPGTVAGTTPFETIDEIELTLKPIAITCTTYKSPFVRPVMVHVSAEVRHTSFPFAPLVSSIAVAK